MRSIYLALICSVSIACFCNKSVAQANKGVNFDIWMGICSQAFLFSGNNPQQPQNLTQISMPYRSADGFGAGLSADIYLANGIGLNYSPTIRYDFIRYEDIRTSTSLVKELIIDHHFSVIKKMKVSCIGVGYSIISTGKGYEAFYSVSKDGAVYQKDYVDLQFEAYHLFARFKLFDKFSFEPKVLYSPHVEYQLDKTYSTFGVLSFRYHML